MINSALSSSMSVNDLVPKAATKLPDSGRGDGAFGEALAGARTVHDQRDARDSAVRDRFATRATDRSRATDQAADARRSTEPDRTARPEPAPSTEPGAGKPAARAAGDDAGPRAEQPTGGGSPTDAADAADDAAQAAAEADAAAAAGQQVVQDAGAAVQATLAVAAAPVPSDLDAVVVPTATGAAQVTTDAVDAAMRLAIQADAGVDAATTDTAAVQSAAATTQVAATNDAADDDTTATAIALGAEDVQTGDADAGPTRPIASTPAATSGPSPAQLAAATFDAGAAVETTPDVDVAAVAVAGTTDVAKGTGTDADAQLVQAAAVDADAGADATTDLDPAATTAVHAKAIKADAGAVDANAALDVDVVDADAPEAAQVARLTQQQAPTVAANAQYQAQVQAKVAEQAAEEGSDAAAPKPDAASGSLQPLSSTTRTDPATVLAGVRVREGVLGSGVQERIDHIAEQLATRLRLSHAAGGSHVNLSLKPRELGEVTVQMNVRDGAVAATVLVDRSDTLRTLQVNIEELKRSLEDQGLTIQEFSVDVRGEAGAGGQNARAAADLRHSATRTSAGSTSSIAGAASVSAPGLSGDREVDPDALHDGDVSVLA